MPPYDGPSVDVIVPLRNEAHTIPAFLAMLRAQTLPPRTVIVADGMSEDASRTLLRAAQERMPELRLRIIDNPERIVPAALNACLREVGSAVVARMDTHAEYDPEYLATVVQCLAERPDVAGVGGAMSTRGRGVWGQAIASTLRRPWGLGGARHRVGGASGPIPHVFSGCYRTEALRSIGGWDERFHANEDFEADTRLREAGHQLWLEPRARSTWFVRESPSKLAVQMWRYGYFKALTLRLHPDALQVRQLAPPALVVVLVAGSLVDRPRTVGVAGIYLSLTAVLGARASAQDGSSMIRGAVVPAIVHLSWGSGLLAGLFTFWRPARAGHRESRTR
ncbi:MAG: glycosyltransferase family 2 protein [Nocardioides sp.]|nr:glycosyltransferase family 2 protein [Nocardioides sp.]